MPRKHPEKGLHFVFEKLSEEAEKQGMEKLVLMKGKELVGELSYYRPQQPGWPLQVLDIIVHRPQHMASIAVHMVSKAMDLYQTRELEWSKLKGPGKKALDLLKKRHRDKIEGFWVEGRAGNLRVKDPALIKPPKYPLIKRRRPK